MNSWMNVCLWTVFTSKCKAFFLNDLRVFEGYCGARLDFAGDTGYLISAGASGKKPKIPISCVPSACWLPLSAWQVQTVFSCLFQRSGFSARPCVGKCKTQNLTINLDFLSLTLHKNEGKHSGRTTCVFVKTQKHNPVLVTHAHTK